jgi:nucleoside-diphosphate-sugar epimerase
MENVANEPGGSLVIGGSGLVGGYIVEHLVRRGERVRAVSRSAREGAGAEWLRADLRAPETLKFPPFTTFYCTTDAILLADARPASSPSRTPRWRPSAKRSAS